MFVVIAQGDGFYGSAFFTTDADLMTIRMALSKIGVTSGQQGNALTTGLTAAFPPDTVLSVRTWAGQAQLRPVVLVDSGNAEADLRILERVLSELNSQSVADRCAEFVSLPGWQTRACSMRLDEQELIARATKSTKPPLQIPGEWATFWMDG